MSSDWSRATAFALLAVFLSSSRSESQSLDGVAPALWPLPAKHRSDALVLRSTSEGTFETVREGRGGYFCIADEPNDEYFFVECHPEALRSYSERLLYLSETRDKAVRDSLINQELKSGQLALPQGALSHYVSGKLDPETGVADTVWVWSEIAVPFADPEATGIPTENMGPAPWLMRAHTHSAHVMIGYEPIAWDEFVRQLESDVGAK